MDWDGDGLLDIICGDRNGFINYFRRTSNDAITLTTMPDITCSSVTIDVEYNSAPVILDWDEDGDLDMLVGNQTGNVRLYLNTSSSGEPVFTSYSLIQSGGSNIVRYRNCPQVFDLDEDGNKDLLCGANDYRVWYYRNVGTNEKPEFDGSEQLIYKYAGMRFWLADWNGDGLTDALSSDYNGYVWVWIQIPTGIGGSGIEIPARTLTSSGNPFMESAMIQGEGFQNATISIFDISGHRVVSEPFNGSYTWSGDIAIGAYFVQVQDEQGVETLRLVKL